MAKASTAARPEPADRPPKHVWLVDGSGYIFRAFHALPPLSRPDGTPVNAVYGFANMIAKFVEDPEIDHVAVIFDHSRATFRNEIYPEYKAQRPDPPEELVPQFPLIRDATRAFNLACIEKEGFEADDLIATFARQAREQGADVTIVSSDKDLMQLVGPGIRLWDPIKMRPIGAEAVMEKFGVPPDKVVEVQALAGDSTDNVPGVPGIGVKTAAQLINEYGDLETLLARAGEIKQPKRREALQVNAELARVSRQLVLLKNDVPVEENVDDFDKRQPKVDVLIPWLEQQGFRTLLSRWRAHLGDAPAGAPVAAPAAATPATPAVTAAPATPQPAKAQTPFGPADYELVRDAAALKEWVTAAYEAGVVAFDCETSALDAMNSELVGISLALAEGPSHGIGKSRRRACYIPLAHRAGSGAAQGALDFNAPDGKGKRGADGRGTLVENQIPLPDALAILKPMLEDPGILKVGQNCKYDLAVFARYGIAIAPIDDTMLLSFVLDAGKHIAGHGMDELAELHLNVKTIKFADVAGTGRNRLSFDYVPLDKARDYAAEDADVAMQLWLALKPRLIAEHMTTVYESIERPLITVLLGMEREGVKVDAGALKDLSTDFARRMAAMEEELHKLVGREFNVNSPKQLGEILFDEMKLPGGKRMKTGAWGTDAGVLEDLANQGHALPRKVLEYREIAKLKSTYTDALFASIDPKTGRVHTSYMMTGAATGRLASTEPNLQNIPVRTEEGRKIRRAFVADKGNVLLSADYSQIELRLLAHVADIAVLKEAFARGDDIHAITASQVFGVPIEGMDPLMRRRAKTINFGIIYGISAFGLSQQLGIPQGEARTYIQAYFARYPGILDYIERTKAFARANGYVQTPFGRKIHLRGINEKNPGMRAFSERAAINAPLQGGAADVIKRAMRRLPGALAREALKTRMLLQVHDELVFETPKTEVDVASATIRRIMESAATLSVPLVVETGTGPTWADAH
jgi:DNA polymerase-1